MRLHKVLCRQMGTKEEAGFDLSAFPPSDGCQHMFISFLSRASEQEDISHIVLGVFEHCDQ